MQAKESSVGVTFWRRIIVAADGAVTVNVMSVFPLLVCFFFPSGEFWGCMRRFAHNEKVFTCCKMQCETMDLLPRESPQFGLGRRNLRTGI